MLAAPSAFGGLGLGGLLGGSCPGTSSQVFAPWGDSAYYYPVPNGGLEGGASGWTLSGGASVVAGNQPFLASGSHGLSLPSGSSATSPTVCIGPNSDFVRMFVSDAAGTDSGLRVRIVWYGLLNRVLGTSDFGTFAPGGGWAPSDPVSSGSGFNFILPILGSTSARIQLTPLGGGSRWLVDDLYVDPIGWR
jgi:hypothetical protein